LERWKRIETNRSVCQTEIALRSAPATQACASRHGTEAASRRSGTEGPWTIKVEINVVYEMKPPEERDAVGQNVPYIQPII
jgi:hypothetical protein